MEQKLAWNVWNPSLDNDDKTLAEVKESLPANDPDEIGLLVRLLENPKSPFALTGAVTLERHDCIHVLLGRGLLPQDEAFVIGFTMGTAKDDLSPTEIFIFKKVARYLYPMPYNLSKKNLIAYELGVEAGKACKGYKIYQYPIEEWDAMTIGEIRRKINIDTEMLREFYRKEAEALPDTKATKRLAIF
jgi:hypothetical protein